MASEIQDNLSNLNIQSPATPASPAVADTTPQVGGDVTQPPVAANPADQQQAPAPQPPNPEAEQEPSRADFSLMNKFIRSALLHSTNNVEVIRADPNSPLYSVKSFEELNLDEALLKGVYQMGFSKPSKIQETALPILIKERKNMVAQSQSGTGKTAAFVLASLSRVDTTAQHPQVIILAPTYELAKQTLKVATTMAHYKQEIKFRFVAKGEPFSERGAKWTEHVLIGTPGRMNDAIFKFANVDMNKIRVYVLDEADIMLDIGGHKVQTMRIRRSLPKEAQILFFSATYDEEVRNFASGIAPDAVEIRLKQEEQSLANIQQYYVVTRTEEDKYRAIANIYGTLSIGQTFIFCRTRKSADFLAQRLRSDGHKVGLISGDLTVEQRAQALEDFKNGEQRVMISTNLMARGIDIESVTLVVNYDLPVEQGTGQVDKETYLHRIGRTGRFGKDGIAINMISSAEEKQMIDILMSHFGQPIHELDATNLEELEKLEG